MIIQEISCPECGSFQHYTLKDNRLRCASCRKKYTLSSHRGKLSQNTLERIAKSFCLMMPATSTAMEMGLNSKTILKYYDLLRRTIAESNENYVIDQFGAATINPALFYECSVHNRLGEEAKPLFCLAKNDGQFFLLVTKDISPDKAASVAASNILGWVYARNHSAFDSLDLDSIHFISTAEKNVADASDSFWPYAKKGLVKYHGGFRKNFPLFMREMEFRFNNNKKDSTLEYLISILQGDPNNTETGDDNVQA